MKTKQFFDNIKHIGFHKLYAVMYCAGWAGWEEYYRGDSFDCWKDFHRRKFSRIRKINHRNKKLTHLTRLTEV